MKHTRRDFLIGSLGLTLGGCAVLNSENSGNKSRNISRVPTGNGLGLRLSKPITEMKPHYEALVVGSGYGASVIAARLTGKFKDLCVLERGKEFHPGDFSDDPANLKKNTLKSMFEPLGLVDITNGKDIDIICGNGLGGTSLINAAIAIRPEMNLFDLDVWPQELQVEARSGKLEGYYQEAEKILQPAKLDQVRFNKSRYHKVDTEKAGRKWGELSLNIRPESYGSGPKNNDFGYPQSACVSCGNCCTGCNYGAKNTLLTNYLMIAYKRGAQIFTQVEVEHIEKLPDRYRLSIKLIEENGRFERKSITATHVFLGAGSKGSTEILMRSQSTEFQFSKALGTRLSANGDVMGLSYNTDHRTDSMALMETQLKGTQGRPGLIISSYADYRNPSMDGDVKSQFLLLDGVVPSSLAPKVAWTFANLAFVNQRKLYKHLTPAEKEVKLERIKIDRQNFNQFSPDGAMNHSMLYFACGHDSSGGKFIYNKFTKNFKYVWKDVVKEPTFLRMENEMRKYSKSNGGVFIPNPRSKWLGGNIQATHPLGGCPMGEDVSRGVVSHLGEVFNAQGGKHENLYVVDAAIIPHSLSATPLLTITAFAERIADRIANS